MSRKRFMCPNCGRFANEQYVNENGCCEECDESDLGLLREEAGADPTGPVYYALTGDDSRPRRRWS